MPVFAPILMHWIGRTNLSCLRFTRPWKSCGCRETFLRPGCLHCQRYQLQPSLRSASLPSLIWMFYLKYCFSLLELPEAESFPAVRHSFEPRPAPVRSMKSNYMSSAVTCQVWRQEFITSVWPNLV